MRLAALLQSMDDRALAALCERRGVAIDPDKRIGPREQATRALAIPPALGGWARWPDEVRSVARTVAAHPDGVLRASIGGAVLPLVRADLVFVHPEHPDRVVMPDEWRAQIPPSPADSPRAARLLLSRLDDETLHVVASSHVKRAGATPRALLLGELLAHLESPAEIRRAIDGMPPKERRLLSAVEARGGELETAELLELEKEPARIAGPVLPRSAASFQLLRRGFLLPSALGVYAIPTEVAETVGRERRAAAARVRAEMEDRVRTIDLTPSRARLAEDAGAATVVLLATLAAEGVHLRSEAGAPRSAVRRAARAAGVDPDVAEMLVALGRAADLATSSAPIASAGARLFHAWRTTDAFDEARDPPDGFRAPDRVVRVPTPTAALRDAIVDLLASLPKQRFAEIDRLLASAAGDLRASSAGRVLERARKVVPGAFAEDVAPVLRRILLESLPALGAVDRGTSDDGEVVRLSAHARRWLSAEPEAAAAPGRWTAAGRFAVSGATPIAHLVDAVRVARAFATDGSVYLEIDERSIREAAARGTSTEDARALLERVTGELDAASARAIAEVERERRACVLVPAGGFLVVDDPTLRQAILEDPDAAELVVTPSPPGGVLVRPGVAIARLARLVRRHGGEVDGSAVERPAPP